MSVLSWMLFTLQRYEFFSKSQRSFFRFSRRLRCCLPYKGTNFSANHNETALVRCFNSDVVYPTKVRIFQQITTGRGLGYQQGQMLFTLQRYEFFSKSQPTHETKYRLGGCCLPYKGTNFSANHNLRLFGLTVSTDVVYPTKVRIFQQITTLSVLSLTDMIDVVYPTKVRIFQQITTSVTQGVTGLMMLFTLQRYEFFSKSQRG